MIFLIALPESSTYNGWKNYETWCVNLWLTNDATTYNTCRDVAEASRNHASKCEQVGCKVWTLKQATRFTLADRLRSFVEEASPLAATATLYSDLLNAASSEVDWHENADAFLEE